MHVCMWVSVQIGMYFLFLCARVSRYVCVFLYLCLFACICECVSAPRVWVYMWVLCLCMSVCLCIVWLYLHVSACVCVCGCACVFMNEFIRIFSPWGLNESTFNTTACNSLLLTPLGNSFSISTISITPLNWYLYLLNWSFHSVPGKKDSCVREPVISKTTFHCVIFLMSGMSCST